MTKYLAQGAIFTAIAAVSLFGAAGRNVAGFWLYLAIIGTAALASRFALGAPLLLEREQQVSGALRFATLLPVAHWILAGLDYRFRWSVGTIETLQGWAAIALAGGLLVTIWAMRTNPFFSSVARVQRERGQYIVKGGPYRWVRHPGYAGLIVAVLASGIALGSWIATLVAVPCVVLLLRRTLTEDSMMTRAFVDYRIYSLAVSARLIPGIW